jgi:hypothetical protein
MGHITEGNFVVLGAAPLLALPRHENGHFKLLEFFLENQNLYSTWMCQKSIVNTDAIYSSARQPYYNR